MSAGRETWREEAACIDKPVEWFFPEREGGNGRNAYEQGRVICRDCPVQLDCLRWSQAEDIGYGLWGGLTPIERGTYRRRVRYPETLATGGRNLA